MIVKDIKALDNKKSLVTTDENFRFSLYKGEVKRFGLELDKEICIEIFNQIKEVLEKRCRERALYIIERNDKTEKEVRRKLTDSYYPENIVDMTIEFLKKYDYINDYRYASNYIRIKKGSKSRRELEYDMNTKGISKEILSEVFESFDFDNIVIIEDILKKRNFDFEKSTKEQCNKQIQYLLRKGFLYEDIVSVIKGKFN